MSRRFFLVTSAALTGAVTCLTSTHANASFYPPDYVVEQTCQTQGPLEVCALNRSWGQYPRISVRYQGSLLARQWGRIAAYVRLNGISGIYRMTNANYAESVTINDPATRLCYVVDSNLTPPLPPLPEGPYTYCLHTLAPGGGGIVWEADPVPVVERELFFFARNDQGGANAWDVSVALVTDDGEWDSQNGANYTFRFE